MATVQEIKAAAKEVEDSKSRYGCFILEPPVALKCKVAINKKEEDIGKVGDIVHANRIDERGPYPNHVHLIEKGFWWHIRYFEVCETSLHVCYNPYGGRIFKVNADGSGVVESNFGNFASKAHYDFTPNQVFGFGNDKRMKVKDAIIFSLDAQNKIKCVHTIH